MSDNGDGSSVRSVRSENPITGCVSLGRDRQHSEIDIPCMRASRKESPGNGDERGEVLGAKEKSIKAIQENRRRKRGKRGRSDARKRAEETFGGGGRMGRLHVKK